MSPSQVRVIKRVELTEVQRELGRLPRSIDEIIALEAAGYVVNLVTGELSLDLDPDAVAAVPRSWQMGV